MGNRGAEDAEEAEWPGAFGGAVPEARARGPGAVVSSCSGGSGSPPGSCFSENSAARDSRQFGSTRNLSSKCLVLEAGALEVLRTVPGEAGDSL